MQPAFRRRSWSIAYLMPASAADSRSLRSSVTREYRRLVIVYDASAMTTMEMAVVSTSTIGKASPASFLERVGASGFEEFV